MELSEAIANNLELFLGWLAAWFVLGIIGSWAISKTRFGSFLDVRVPPHPGILYHSDIVRRGGKLRLSAKGKKIFRGIGGDALVEKYIHKVRIPRKADRLAIQDTCFLFALNDIKRHLDKREIRAINNYAFECGYNSNVLILASLGVPLRDKALKLRNLA